MGKDYTLLTKDRKGEPLPCPHIGVVDRDKLVERIKTHLVSEEVIDSDTSTEEMLGSYDEPFIVASKPLFNKISISRFEEQEPAECGTEYINKLSHALSHETLHLVVYLIEGSEASKDLDNLDVSDVLE